MVLNTREFDVLAAFDKFFNAGGFDAAGWKNAFDARDFDAGGTSTRGFFNVRVTGELRGELLRMRLVFCGELIKRGFFDAKVTGEL